VREAVPIPTRGVDSQTCQPIWSRTSDRGPVPTTLLPDYNKSDHRLPVYSQREQRLPAYGRTELRMLELSRGDSRPPVYPTRRESPIPEPMVDILTGDYYHPEPTKKPLAVLENGMTVAFDG
jgi:hypothetical protein